MAKWKQARPLIEEKELDFHIKTPGAKLKECLTEVGQGPSVFPHLERLVGIPRGLQGK